MLSFWAGGISSFPPCAREYRLLRRLCLQRSDKHSISQIGLQELAYRVVCQAYYPPTSIQTVFRLFVRSIFIKCTLFLSNMCSPIIPIGFLSLGLRKRARYWAFQLISVLYFPLGNMFCSNKTTLAFRWRPWVNNRDTTGLSVVPAIKSSRMMMMLLYRGLISHRFSDCSGTPLSNRILFSSDVFKSS